MIRRPGGRANLRDVGGWGPWRPTRIPGCVLWLRADLGVTLVSGKVSAWADQSGMGNHFTQATGADQMAYVAPAYNGHPALRHGDASDHMTAAAFFASGGEMTTFLVFKPSTLGSTYEITGAGGTYGLISNFSVGQVEWFNVGGTGDRYLLKYLPTDALHIATIRQTNGAALQGWWDGVSVFGPAVPVRANQGWQRLGYISATNSGNGDKAEWIVYDRALSDDQIAAEHQRLKLYWGIAA
jgi:hypothetical protein